MTHGFRHGLGLVAAAMLTTASLAASVDTNPIVNGDFADTKEGPSSRPWRSDARRDGGEAIPFPGEKTRPWSRPGVIAQHPSVARECDILDFDVR